MPLLELNLTPSRKELRWFAGLWWPSLWAIVGTMLFRKFHMPAAAVSVWAIAGLLSLAGLIAPPIIRPFYTILLYLTYPIGYILSYVILFVVYFGVFTPVGLLFRCFHDSMGRRFDRSTGTYWTPHEVAPQDRYFRQF